MNRRKQGAQLKEEATLLSWVQKRTRKFVKSTEAAIMFTGDSTDQMRSWV